jgi:hypothetical protein
MSRVILAGPIGMCTIFGFGACGGQVVVASERSSDGGMQAGERSDGTVIDQSGLGSSGVFVRHDDGADGSAMRGGMDNSGASSRSPSDAFGFLPDSSASPIEGFEIIFNGDAQTPLSCPSSRWEFSVPSTATVTLRDTGTVPLAYIAEPTGYIGGVQYTPGVPTSQQEEEVGVLAPGDIVSLTLGGLGGDTIALIGASKPFSIYDGGLAPADEWRIPWPMGVDGRGGSTKMYVADIEWDTACSPVERQ